MDERRRSRITIEWPDDEHVEIRIDGVMVASADAAEHGPIGMEAVERTALAVARAFGAEVVDGEAILRADAAETHTGWGVRLTWGGGKVVEDLLESEAEARRRVEWHAHMRAKDPYWGATAELIRRTVTTGPWTVVEADRG